MLLQMWHALSTVLASKWMVLLICHGLQATQNGKLKELLRYTDEILSEVRHTIAGLWSTDSKSGVDAGVSCRNLRMEAIIMHIFITKFPSDVVQLMGRLSLAGMLPPSDSPESTGGILISASDQPFCAFLVEYPNGYIGCVCTVLPMALHSYRYMSSHL